VPRPEVVLSPGSKQNVQYQFLVNGNEMHL
jgi:hypothetical protein